MVDLIILENNTNIVVINRIKIDIIPQVFRNNIFEQLKLNV